MNTFQYFTTILAWHKKTYFKMVPEALSEMAETLGSTSSSSPSCTSPAASQSRRAVTQSASRTWWRPETTSRMSCTRSDRRPQVQCSPGCRLWSRRGHGGFASNSLPFVWSPWGSRKSESWVKVNYKCMIIFCIFFNMTVTHIGVGKSKENPLI